MPNRLPYHQRRLIARGLVKAEPETVVEESVSEAPIVIQSEEEFDVKDE